MRIAVVSAPVPEKYLFPLISSGFGVVSGFLRQKGYDIDQVDLSLLVRLVNNFGSRSREMIDLSVFTSENVRRYLSTRNPKIEREAKKIIKVGSLNKYEVLCFSIPATACLRVLLPVFLLLKAQNKSIKIIVGGSFTHREPHLKTLAKYVDYIINGDCEPVDRVLRHVLYREEIGDYNGIITKYKDNKNPITYYSSSLAEQALPYYERKLLDTYSKISLLKIKIVPYQVGRGCINRCTFCNYFDNQKYEYKPIPKVVKDLRTISEKYGSRVFFCDSNFFNNTRYVEELCDALIEQDIKIEWGTLASIVNKSEDFFKKLREAGCRFLAYGLESGSDSVLRRMKKPYNSKTASKVLKRTHNAGINIFVFVITNFVNESWKEFYQTIDFLAQNSRYIQYVSTSPLFLLRGSELFEKNEDYDIRIKLKERPQKFLGPRTVKFDDIHPSEVREELGLFKLSILERTIHPLSWNILKNPMLAFKYVLNRIKYPNFNDYSIFSLLYGLPFYMDNH